jgi:hypothetical protein
VEIIHDVDEVSPQPLPGPDARSGLIFNGYLGTNRLIALAQPTDWSQSGIEYAARVLETLHRTLVSLARASDLSPGDRIRRSFEAANTDLLTQAKSQSDHHIEARSGVGSTVVLVEGTVATIGMIPPAQALLWQDGRLTWCPTRESWTGQQPGLTGSPLGWTTEPKPTVVATSVNQRDELVLTTDALAKQLAQTPPGALRSSEALCNLVGSLAGDETIDTTPLMAVSTRFIAPTMTGTLLGSTRHALMQIEHRARSAWTALRTQT